MYKIVIVSDSHKHFASAIQEYVKRLGKSLQIVQIKPSKKDTIELVKKEDTENIIKVLQKESGYKIYMDIGGETFSTEKFAHMLDKKKQNVSKIIFVIGGVYGSTDEIYSMTDTTFSLSSLTFPHGGALLMLLEQIYRIECIVSGKNYHY